MLINKNKKDNNHVRFISYTGAYPNLCRGVLTLLIDDKEVKFGHDYRDYNWETNTFNDNNYNSFWTSGGGLDRNYYPYHNEWIINVEDIPEEYRKYATEIDEVFNCEVSHGCCGGCA